MRPVGNIVPTFYGVMHLSVGKATTDRHRSPLPPHTPALLMSPFRTSLSAVDIRPGTHRRQSQNDTTYMHRVRKLSSPREHIVLKIVISRPIFLKLQQVGQIFVVNERVCWFPAHLNAIHVLTLLCKIVNEIIQNDRHRLTLAYRYTNKKLHCRREAARCFVFVCSQLRHTYSAVFLLLVTAASDLLVHKSLLNYVLLSPIVSGGVRPKLPGQTTLGHNPLVFCCSWVGWGQDLASWVG